VLLFVNRGWIQKDSCIGSAENMPVINTSIYNIAGKFVCYHLKILYMKRTQNPKQGRIA
jgi:hypothetical protein